VKDAARRDDIEAIIQLGLLSLNWDRDEAARVKVLLHPAGAPTVADGTEAAEAGMARRDVRSRTRMALAPFGAAIAKNSAVVEPIR